MKLLVLCLISCCLAGKLPEGVDDLDDVSLEESERLFDSYRYSRAAVPASYSAVTAGLVTPVKSQGNCGSCAAFATMALVETCFAKNIGGASKTGDYSEQHFVDCGYGYNGMINGCNGAA